MSKYLFFFFLLLLACNKDNVVEINTPPPPSSKDYFLLNYDIGKENRSSFWEVIITSHENGSVTIKYKYGLTELLFTSNKDTVVYLRENFDMNVGDTLWFTRSLEDDPNPQNRFDYNRRDQQQVAAETTVK